MNMIKTVLILMAALYVNVVEAMISASLTELKNAFPGATVSGSSSAFSVQLQSDVGPIVLKDYFGKVTVDLNGHSITGRADCVSAADGAAITITYNTSGSRAYEWAANFPLQLVLTGTGSVIGGRGADATETTPARSGGYAIYCSGVYRTNSITIQNGEDVVIRGGRGGDDHRGGVAGIGGYGCYFRLTPSSYPWSYGTITAKLDFSNKGLVCGGDGGTSSGNGGNGGYGTYFADSFYTAMSANTGTVQGGVGGMGGAAGGTGGTASNKVVGNCVRGTNGEVDPRLFFDGFIGATVVETENGGHLMTLTVDRGALTIPDSIGELTLDLNGHTITGSVYSSSVVSQEGSALVLKRAGTGTPTQLTITGAGEIVGGHGGNEFLSSVYMGGCGIYAQALQEGCSLTIGPEVVVRGGQGTTASGASYRLTSGVGGSGGPGVSLTASSPALPFTNQGTVVGGTGGTGGVNGGSGGTAYVQAASNPAQGTGSFEEGAKGGIDQLLYLSQNELYRAATYSRNVDGVCVVTLTNDVTNSVEFRDDVGAYIIDLNGHTMSGTKYSNETMARPAIQFVDGTVGAEPTTITFIGNGLITSPASENWETTDYGCDGTAVIAATNRLVSVGTMTAEAGVVIRGAAGSYGGLVGGVGGKPFVGDIVWTGAGTLEDGAYGGDGYATRIAQEFPGAEITQNGAGYSVKLTRDIGGVLIPANRSPFVIDLNGFSIVGAAGTLAETEGEHAITVLNTASGENFSLTLIGAGTVVGGAGFSGDSSYSADEGGCGIFVDGNATRLTLAVGEGVTVQGGVGGLNLASGCDGAYGGDGVRGSGVDAFTLVNAGQIRGGVGGDGDDEGYPGGEAIDLWPSAATGDSICVTNTVTGVIQGGDGGNGRYSGDGYEAIYVGTYAAFTVENNGEIRGGSSPDAWPDPGVGAEAIGGSSTYTLTGSGTVVRGTDGREDNMKPVKNAFPGATVEMMGTMGVKVTLNDDIGPCVIPDGVGSVTIDLNGYSIIGQSGCSSSADGAALTVRGYGDSVYLPTELTFTGTGSIVGGAGLRSSNDTEATVGGDGIFIDDSVESIFISIGADVTVSGGHGGDAIGRLEVDAADGGCAIDTYASNTFIENAGEIIGGKGGDYVGTYSEGTGADGSEAIYCGGRELTIDNAGIIEGGSGGYGIAESGYANEAIDGGYSTLTVTNREDALIVGGSGGPGGEDGGDGYSAIWAQSSAAVTIVNDGTLVGGEGGMAWPYPGEGAVALAVGSGANVTGSGEVVDGEFGLYDMLTPLRESFPDVRLKLDDAGGYVVKLTEDVGPVTLLDNLGPFTIDLNGHSITGNPGCVVNRGGAALVFVPGDGEGLGGTQVSFTGPGAIIGACGLNQTLTDAATDGMPAFCVSNAVSYAVSVSLGDGVTATGGAGGNAFTASGVGRGSVVTDGTLTLQGTTAKGANGVVDVIDLLRGAFPNAIVEGNGTDGYRVTLKRSQDPATIYDNMGNVTIDLNGMTINGIKGTVFTDARCAITIEHLDAEGLGPTQLTLTGGGTLAGGTGRDATAKSEPTKGGSGVGVGAGVRSGMSVTAEAGVTVRGGNGGLGFEGGLNGSGAMAVAKGVARAGEGTFIDGDGCFNDILKTALEYFPASVEAEYDRATDVIRVTLTEDIFNLVLPEDLGALEIDLDGHAIRGTDATSEQEAGNAITVKKIDSRTQSLALTLIGPGSVLGGTGEGVNDQGGDAIRVEDHVYALSLDVGEGVTVQGGKGWNAFDGALQSYGGSGGCGIIFSSCEDTFSLRNAGTIAGGNGGDYVGESAEGDGGSGNYAVYVDGDYDAASGHARLLTVENTATGIISGGNGGTGVDDASDGYEGLYVEYFLAGKIINDGIIKGGDGGEGGAAYGGSGEDAVYTYNFVDLEIENTGSIFAGCGGDGTQYGGDVEYALYGSSLVNVKLTNTGLIQGGDGGNGSVNGGDSDDCVYFDGSSSGTCEIVNEGLIQGGNGGNGGDEGGDGYSALEAYSFQSCTLVNNGEIIGGNGGFGRFYGGDCTAETIELGGITTVDIVNNGTIAGGNGGASSEGEAGYGYNAIYCYDITTLNLENSATGILSAGDGGDGGTYGGTGYEALYVDTITDFYLVNAGSILGGNGGFGLEQGGTVENVCHLSGSNLYFTNTGSIIGTCGGNSATTPGDANPTIGNSMSNVARYETEGGRIVENRPGEINLLYALQAMFGDAATISGNTNDGFRIVLTRDIAGIRLRENWGNLTIDLNGHSILGADATAAQEAGAAIAVAKVDSPAPSLALTLVGPGSVVGGTGFMDNYGGDAIYIEDYVSVLSLNVGEGVTVQGGKGWASFDGASQYYGGHGGYGIYFKDCTNSFTLVNAGTIAGGDGGDYQGTNPEGDGGYGYYGIYVYGTANESPNYAKSFVITNLATGVIRGGDGGKGNNYSEDGYEGLHIEYFESATIVNDGLIRGGNGADGGNYGGYGEEALYLCDFGKLEIDNRGTIAGGNGGNALIDGENCDDAIDMSYVEECILRNTGTIRGGKGGDGGVYGDSSYYTLSAYDIDSLTIDNAGTIIGGDGGNGGDDGGSAYEVLSLSSIGTLNFTNSADGVVQGGDGGNGGSNGGCAYEVFELYSVSNLVFVNEGSILGGNGGFGSQSGGYAEYVLYASDSYSVDFANNGTMTTGNGCGGEDVWDAGSVYETIYISSYGTISFTNGETGVIKNGDGGQALWEGGYAEETVYLSASSNIVFTNAGTIQGGNGGNGGVYGGDAYNACSITSSTAIDFTNTGTIAAGNGGAGGVYGGSADLAINLSAETVVTNLANGILIDGVPGRSGVDDTRFALETAFPDATVTVDETGLIWVVTLAHDIDATSIPDNVGTLMLDLNGYTINAPGTLSYEYGSVGLEIADALYDDREELSLSIVGPGTIYGTDGYEASNWTAGNGYAALSFDSPVDLTFTNTATLIGGNGGNSGNTPGMGSTAIVCDETKVTQVSWTNTGTLVDGQDGILDTSLVLVSYFPGQQVESDGNGGCLITLNSDIKNTVQISDNLGPVTINLNGHVIKGADSPRDGQNAAAAIKITRSYSSTGTPLSLTFFGPGSVLGGNGHASSASPRSSSLNGQPAITVNSSAKLAALTVGEGVTIRGGDGAEYATTSTNSGDAGSGGAGFYYSSAAVDFTLSNAGTIAGGNGGPYSGRYSSGYAGSGANGVYWYGSSSLKATVTNAVTGVIAGGNGGDLRYNQVYTSSIGSKAGSGAVALSVGGNGTKSLQNDGLIIGGNGGNTAKTSGSASGGAASSLTPSSSSTGTLNNGFVGSYNQTTTLQNLFSGSIVTRDPQTGVYTVTLQKDYTALALPDNLGNVTISMNGYSIVGNSSKAAITFSAKNENTLPTRLTLTGSGTVAGFNGASSATGIGGNGTPAFSIPAGTATVSIDVGEGVTVRGGNGGDSTTTAGTGASAVQMATGVVCAVTGETVDGNDGVLYENDFAFQFPGAMFTEDEDGNVVITLMQDVAGPVTMKNNLGSITLDLNGHSIYGQDGKSSLYEGALSIVSATPNETPTVLTITGKGSIIGGMGYDSANSSRAGQGGIGLYVNAPDVTLILGEDVVVQGGEGGVNSYNGSDGLGGYGLYTTGGAARFTLDNFGTIVGGRGSSGSSSTGGIGMVNTASGYGNIGLSVTNEATGQILGGDGKPGAVGSTAIYANVSDSVYVNLGTIKGGRGGEGGCDGGDGIYPRASSSYPSTLVNEGVISGGDGSDGDQSVGAGGEAKYTYNWGNFNYSGNGELLSGTNGESTFANLLQEELGTAFDISLTTGYYPSIVLTLKEDLHETFVLDPLSWGADFMTIELDMNGHSIYGTDGTAEHPDGFPGILRLDEESQWNSEHGSTFKIYDSTQSSNSVIRGGHGYPSSTDAPGGNGGDGITAPNAGLRTKVVSDIDGIQIWGGNGGENTGTGDGGNGGCAIRGEPHYLQDVEFHGGDGGDAITGDGGDGGDAILGFIGESDIGGNIWLYGGKGGNSQAGDGGNGGHGQHSDPHEDNYYFTRGIFYTGGDGGSSIDGDGGDGGHGLWGFAGEWNGGTILHGGDGGTSVNGDGGNGGDGLRGDGESLGGRDDPHETTGGNGGASVNGMGGNGGNGITYIPYDDSYRKAETATTFHLQLDSEGGEGADGFFRGLGGSGVVFGDDPHQGGEELNVTSSTSSNGPDGHGLNWEYPVVGPGILDWQDLIDDPWIANTYIGETNAYMTVSIDGGEPIQVRYNDTDGTFLPEQIIFGGETDTVHHVAVQFHTSSTRITATRPTGKVKDWGFKPYDINIKVPVTHPESEPFSLSNLGTVPAAEEKGKTILCDARIDTTANLDENGRQLDSTVNPAPTKAPTTGTMDYWYVAQNPRRPDDTSDTLAMTAPTLSAREPTTFTVGGIEGLSKFSWEMFLKEGTGKAAIKGDLTLSVVKTLDGVVTTNTYTYTAADLENNWKGQDFTFDGPTNAMYDVTFTYTNNSDGDGQALVDNIRWNPLGASLMIVDHEDPGDGYVYLAFQPQLRGTRRTSANVWVQRLIAHGLRAKRGASRAQMEKFAPAEVTFSDRADHQAATDRVWVKVPLAELEQNKGYWRVAVDDAELSFKDFDSTLVDPPAIRSSSSEKDARSVNVFGILKVMSANTNTLVAIPWTWYSAQEKNAADIPVNKLVKTTNLTDGDWLYSHLTDADGNGHYAAWMVQGGRWKAITTVMREGGDDGVGSVMRVGDDSVSIPRGNGVWLVRQRPFEVVNNVTNPIPFWVYGQSVTNAVETEVRPGPGGTYADGSVKAYSTVLGNPYGEATRVNDLQFVGEILGGGVQGDCIVVPSGTSAEKRLYRGLGPQPDKWCWTEMKLVKGRPKTTYDYDVTVPPGLAFWYERRGSGALKVVWPYKPEVPETEGN